MSESLSINVDQVRDIEREMDIRLPWSLRPPQSSYRNKIDSGQVTLCVMQLNNSIFIHLPKTGGTCRRALEASMGMEKDSREISIGEKK